MARILIVDDEPHITRLLEQSFTRDGHDVSATSDPEHGLQLLKEEPFELLISDLRMPVIDGLELLSRSKMIRPNCEVVLITGFATVETAREALTDLLGQALGGGRTTEPETQGDTPAPGEDVGSDLLRRALDDLLGGGQGQ